MDSSLNIVNLIENNPIVNLTKDYNNRLITRIKENFTETQQHLFVSSFYCYLNYNQTTDFVIDLDNIWKWLGFSTKQKAKILLEQHFIMEKDYKLLLNQQVKQDIDQHGGHNKQTFLLNIRTFKLFCIKAGTKKANEIHEYFIKLEDLLQEVIKEECEELKQQLENHISSTKLEKELLREKTILEQFQVNTQCVYYGLIDDKSKNNEKLIKFGNSNNLQQRVEQHKKTYTNFRLVNAFKVENKLHIENAMKNNEELIPYKRTIEINKVKYMEMLAVDKLPFEKIDNIIKKIITSIEYSPENYEKILLENKSLREENIKLKRENRNNYLLEENKKLKKIKEEYTNFMKTTFKKISEENNRIKTEYNNLLKNRQQSLIDTGTSNIEDDIKDNGGLPESRLFQEIICTQENLIQHHSECVNELSRKRLRKYNKHSDGYYYIKDKKYEKLTGTRQEVWENVAYRTSGDLTKSELIMNKYGEIVSKIKSEQSVDELRSICKKKIGING